VGPLRAPAGNVRGISRMDYQPDICKDYKDTGFCSFGDSCKFMHDRSEYTGSWQVEKDWAASQKAAADALRRKVFGLAPPPPAAGGAGAPDAAAAASAAAATADGALPHACFICRGPFVAPVMTSCAHFFCSACAFARFATDPRCAACNKQTLGVFNAVAKSKLPGAAAAAAAAVEVPAPAPAAAAAGGGGDEEDKGGWT
jgi:RING finger protein 113A